MPDYSAWFSGSDVSQILKGLKVWPASDDESPDGSDLQELFQEQCDISADAVKAEFEKRTGWRPFLATRATLKHTATTPDGVLMLHTPARTIYSVTIGGSVVEAGNYWTRPETAALTGSPIEFIQFNQSYYAGRVWTTPDLIEIDAEWGYGTSIPADVWRAGVNMATLHAIAGIQGEQDLGSISEDGFSAGYDLVGPIDDKVRKDIWPAQWEKVVRRYTRVVVL